MLDSLRIAHSALRAFSTAFENAAHNIACADVRSYYPRETRFLDLPNGGVIAETVQPPPAAPVPAASLPVEAPAFLDNGVSLEVEMTSMLVYRQSFTAAVRAAQSADEMLGTLLDVREGEGAVTS
jgi:flagellar basal body rod protein FlgG